MSRRPAVGVCAQIEVARWGVWEDTVTFMQRSYSTSLQQAGAIALLIPPDPAGETDPDQFLDRVDALILAGGSDVDPAAYGADLHPETKGIRSERDRFELALVKRAIERELPVLGVCRGMQLLNVGYGGTLHQHLPDVIGDEGHREVPGRFSDHDVVLAPGSLAARAAGTERISVRSHHHQGIDRIGDGLAISGWAGDETELVEAIELPGDGFVLGTLWHPEEDLKSKIFSSLVQAAVARTGVAG